MAERALIMNFAAPSQHGAMKAKLTLAAVFIAVAAGSACLFQINSGKPPAEEKTTAPPPPTAVASAIIPKPLEVKGPVINAVAANAPEAKPSQAGASQIAPPPQAPQPQAAPPPQVLAPAKSASSGAGSLSGRVLIGPSPAASIKVVLYPPNKDDKSALQMTTKADGQYAFNELKDGAYTLHVELASDKNFTIMEESVEVKGPMRHDIALPDRSKETANPDMAGGQFGGKGPRVHFQLPGGDKRGFKNPSPQAPMTAPGKPAKAEPPEGF